MGMTWCYATLALRAHEHQESRCSCDAFPSRFCSLLHNFPHWMRAPYPTCFLGKPHFWSDGCRSTFALFLFGPPTWLALKLHEPPVPPRNNTPPLPPNYAANAMPVDLHSGVSTIPPYWCIEWAFQLNYGRDSIEHYQVCRRAMIPLLTCLDLLRCMGLLMPTSI